MFRCALILLALALPAQTGRFPRKAAYDCREGELLVTFRNSKEAEVQWQGLFHILEARPERTGVLYTGNGLEFRTRGDEASLLDDDKRVRTACRVRPVKLADELRDSLWRLRAVNEGGQPRPLPEGYHATLEFYAGRVEINTGCNRGRSSFALAQDRLSLSPLAINHRKGCPTSAYSALERGLLQSFRQELQAVIDTDELRLSSPATGYSFVYKRRD